jgi:hypothetical protein
VNSKDRRCFWKVFRLKKEEVPREWRQFDSEELYNLNSSASTVKEVMPRRLRRVGHLKPKRQMEKGIHNFNPKI